jgi:hypothetical protein
MPSSTTVSMQSEARIADEIGVRQLEIEARRFQEEPLGAKGAAIGRLSCLNAQRRFVSYEPPPWDWAERRRCWPFRAAGRGPS